MPSMHMLMGLTREEEDRTLRVQYRDPIAQEGDAWYIKPIEGGMASGRGALHVWIPGIYKRKNVLMYAETSVESWMQATGAIRAKFEAQVNEPGWALVPQVVKDMLIPRYVEALRRVKNDLSEEEATEIATMLIDALEAGSPEEFHG